jgi:hypothetical protein
MREARKLARNAAMRSAGGKTVSLAYNGTRLGLPQDNWTNVQRTCFSEFGSQMTCNAGRDQGAWRGRACRVHVHQQFECGGKSVAFDASIDPFRSRRFSQHKNGQKLLG